MICVHCERTIHLENGEWLDDFDTSGFTVATALITNRLCANRETYLHEPQDLTSSAGIERWLSA